MFTKVPRKLRMPPNYGQGSYSKPLISQRVLCRSTYSKSWIFIKEKISAVIVVDNDCDVDLILFYPFLHRFVTVKKWFPSWLLSTSLIIDNTNGRNM